MRRRTYRRRPSAALFPRGGDVMQIKQTVCDFHLSRQIIKSMLVKLWAREPDFCSEVGGFRRKRHKTFKNFVDFSTFESQKSSVSKFCFLLKYTRSGKFPKYLNRLCKTHANVEDNWRTPTGTTEQQEEEGWAFGLSKLINSEGQMMLYSKHRRGGEGAPALICIKVVEVFFFFVVKQSRCVSRKGSGKGDPLDPKEVYWNWGRRRPERARTRLHNSSPPDCARPKAQTLTPQIPLSHRKKLICMRLEEDNASQKQITARRWQGSAVFAELRRITFPLQDALHHSAGLCGILKWQKSSVVLSLGNLNSMQTRSRVDKGYVTCAVSWLQPVAPTVSPDGEPFLHLCHY